MTTIEIITRHLYTRPRSLARMVATVQAQTYPHITHTILTDSHGTGVIKADGMLANTPARGDYVWTIDDDDLLNDPGAVERLVRFIRRDGDYPPAVICRMKSITHGELPYPGDWQGTPQCGRISGQNIISRADVWNTHRTQWALGVPGDWMYIQAVWQQHAPFIRWMDDVLVDQQYRGYGRPEGEV